MTAPSALHGTNFSGDAHVNLMNRKANAPSKMITPDPDTGPIDRFELVKGYEVSNGEYMAPVSAMVCPMPLRPPGQDAVAVKPQVGDYCQRRCHGGGEVPQAPNAWASEPYWRRLLPPPAGPHDRGYSRQRCRHGRARRSDDLSR